MQLCATCAMSRINGRVYEMEYSAMTIMKREDDPNVYIFHSDTNRAAAAANATNN